MLYKYKKVHDFKYLLDILVNNRLYAAKYTELNDPMEGYYYYHSNEIGKHLINQLKGEKQKYRICSLTKDKDNLVMWSHYADNSKGLVLGVKIKEKNYKIHKVKYLPDLELIKNIDDMSAEKILTNKLDNWTYENEQRILITENSYVNVEIKEIILGWKMPVENKILIKQFLSKIKSKIIVAEK